MHHTIKKLGKETIIYSLTTIIVRGCSYLTLLIQTNILPISAYSIIIEFYAMYIAWGHVIYDLGMDMTYFRFVRTLGKQHTFNSIVTLLLATSLVFSTLLIMYTPAIARLTGHSTHMRYFYYMATILGLDTLLMIPYARLRIETKTFSFLGIKFMQAFTNIIFSFGLLYFPIALRWIERLLFGWFNIQIGLEHLDAVFIANIWSNITALCLLLPSFKGFCLTWSKRTFQIIRGYAATCLLTTLFFRMNETLPLLLLRTLMVTSLSSLDTKEHIMGKFGASCKLTVCITLAIQAFKHAAEPFFFANANEQNRLKLYSQTMYLFIFVSCFGLLIFSLNIDWIAKILIPKAAYREIVNTVPYLAFSHIVLGVYYNLSTAFKLSSRPRYNTCISFLGSLVVCLIGILLIPKWGHWGCVWASLSSATVMTLVGYYAGQKCYPIPYYKEGFVLLVVTCLIVTQITLWPSKLAFLGIVSSYLLLNTMVLMLFSTIAIIRYRSVRS